MELGNGNQVCDVFDAQTHILNYSLATIKSMSLKCAIELDIPDIIHQHGRPMTLSELVEALPINKSKAHGIYRLMRLLVHAGFFESVKTLVDVGGGTGYLMKVVADAFPHLQCFCFDLPHVVAGLEGTNNMTYVSGDMFQAIPPADAVLLKLIMHDWNDEECIHIFKLCKEAIPSKENGGKVIIIDMVVGSQKGNQENTEAQLLSDIGMMSVSTGMEWDEKNWARLFVASGFTHYDIAHKLGQKSLIQLYY